MLESYFEYPGVLRRMRRGPLAAEIDNVAEDLERIGYSRGAAIRYLSLIATFSRYAAAAGCVQAEMVDRTLIESFLRQLQLSASCISVARSALAHVLRHLAHRYPKSTNPPSFENPDKELIVNFDAHLRDVRRLQPISREEVIRLAGRMLAWYRGFKPGKPLSLFGPEDVLAFATYYADGCSEQSTRSAAMSHVRNFLRYLHWAGTHEKDLASQVPRTPIRRLARIPNHLAWEDVQRVINTIDAGTPVGKRDRALLLLLVTTGMRSSEARRLELRDIRWRRGEVLLRLTKNRRDRTVPLLSEAGNALADYILHGRPKTPDPRVFLSHRPPIRSLGTSGTLSSLVRRRLAECGILMPNAGAHLFRHYLPCLTMSSDTGSVRLYI